MFWQHRSYAKQTHRQTKQLFFHFRTLHILRQLKKLYSVAEWKGSPAHFANNCRLCRRAAVFGVSRSAFVAFRLPPFSIALNFFEIILILYWQLNWMTSLVLCKWLYVFWWTVKTAEQARSQKSAMGGCYRALEAEPPTLEKFVFCWQN